MILNNGTWLSNRFIFARLYQRQQGELESLTLTTQPLKTLKSFVMAIAQCLRREILLRSVWLMLLSAMAGGIGVLVMTLGRTHTKLVQELFLYLRFGIWWLALGVVSSIGLGSCLHTFVLCLGPHIALFPIKAVQCGRVDIKSAVYDTIQFNSSPSWLNKDCSDYGTPVFSSKHGSQVPLGSILAQVQLEAILWGIGTALGELPPHFISKAVSDKKVEVTKELNSSSAEDSGIMVSHTNRIQQWLLSQTQYLNFFKILALASVVFILFLFFLSEIVQVPRVLSIADMRTVGDANLPQLTEVCQTLRLTLLVFCAGKLVSHFGSSYLATLIGKTLFIISVCNNQLLDFIESKLISVLSLFPGLAAILPNLVNKLQNYRDNNTSAAPPVTPNTKMKTWDISFALIWNTVVWFMLLNFFVKIVTTTAQSYLKEQQEKELTTSKSI